MAHEPTNLSQGTSLSNKMNSASRAFDTQHTTEKNHLSNGLWKMMKAQIQVRVFFKNHHLNQNCSNCNLISKEETISYVINYLQRF